MKKRSILILVLCLFQALAFSQSIQVTDGGSHLNVTINGVARSIPKKELNLKYVDPNITLSFNGERIFKISNYALVTVPVSSSITDLNSKLAALMVESSGGISVEADPTVPENVKAITSGNITQWSSAITPTGTATLTNKTISGSSNTLSNIPQSAVTSLSTSLSGKQNTLVSGTSIKTVGGVTLLGAGDLAIIDTSAVHKSGAETIVGEKTFTGVLNSANIRPSVNNVSSLGDINLRYSNVYAVAYQNNGTSIYGSTATSAFYFRQGTVSSTNIAGFHASGNFFVQARRSVPSDNTYGFQNYGSAYLGGRTVITDTPTYSDNAAATAANLPVGTIYRTSTGVLMIRY